MSTFTLLLNSECNAFIDSRVLVRLSGGIGNDDLALAIRCVLAQLNAADETAVLIGANQNVDLVKENWTGLLDEMRLYDRELTAEEVKKLAQP